MKCEITLKILKVSGAGEASVDCFQRLTKCYFIPVSYTHLDVYKRQAVKSVFLER